MKPRNAISPRLSAGLDAARAFAAIYVALHHLANAHGFNSGLGFVFRFGQEAVLIFFLLSGFVIFANEHQRALRPCGYYMRRIRRIYPPLLVAMLIASGIALSDGKFDAQFDARELFLTLANLQDLAELKPGVITNPYMQIDPLWSLSYEVFFYAVFPVVLYFWKRRPDLGDHVIGAICCLSYISYVLYPNHFTLVGAYFLVWWAGAAAAHAYLEGANDLRGLMRTWFWLVALCAVAGWAVFWAGFSLLGNYPFLMLRHFAVGAIMVFAFAGQFGKWCCKIIAPFAESAQFFASISYGIYVLHRPLLIQWSVAWTWPGFILALLLLLAASHLVERKLPRILPKAPRS